MADRDNSYITTFYAGAVGRVLAQTDATARNWYGRRVRLPGGLPYQIAGRPAIGPQCVTVSLHIRDEDLSRVLGLGERFALAAHSSFARVYRDLGVVRVEFTLPPEQWRDVHLADLPHRRDSATIGQAALGPPARLTWDVPHKAIFGGSQTGKTTCLIDLVLSLARGNSPDECQLVILNPKNDRKLHPFERLAHLAYRMANNYEDAARLMRCTLAEMERRRGDPERLRGTKRWVVVVDEAARLVEEKPETGDIIIKLSQMAAGLKINLVLAAQGANPTVFGPKGSLAQANIQSRLVFQLPNSHSFLATGLPGQHTERLGLKGDGLAIYGSRVTRFRAATPLKKDLEALPFKDDVPDVPQDDIAGDAAIQDGNWQVQPDMLAYSLMVQNSATALRKEFGGATDKAREVRDYTLALANAMRTLQKRIEEAPNWAQTRTPLVRPLIEDWHQGGEGDG